MKDLFIDSFARIFRIDNEVLRAIIKIESSGIGFVDGKMKIRFEPHIFFDRTTNENATNCFKLGEPRYLEHYYKFNDEWFNVHSSQNSEYVSFGLAKDLDKQVAYESISMGMGQVMGFNYNSLGYYSAQEMFIEFSKGELYQLTGMFSFIANKANLLESIRLRDWYRVAYLYNGIGAADYYESLLKAELD